MLWDEPKSMPHNHCFPKGTGTLRKELHEELEAASGTVRNSHRPAIVPSHQEVHQEPVIRRFILDYIVIYSFRWESSFFSSN